MQKTLEWAKSENELKKVATKAHCTKQEKKWHKNNCCGYHNIRASLPSSGKCNVIVYLWQNTKQWLIL